MNRLETIMGHVLTAPLRLAYAAGRLNQAGDTA